MTTINFDKYYKITTQECDKGFGYLKTLTDELIKNKIFEGCEKILDIGCGTGYWTKYLRGHGFNVVGCDISNNQFKEAIVTDMHQMCFKDKEFDGVFCSGVFEHSIAPFILLHEVNRILKPNGIFYVNMPDTSNTRIINLPQHINTQCYFNMINLTEKVNLELVDYQVINTQLAGLHQYYIFKKIK